LSSIQESPQTQETPLPNYTTSVPGLTSALARTSLGGVGSFAQPITYTGPSFGDSAPPPVSSNYSRRIRTRNKNINSEELDPSFKVHSSKYFKFGEVFKVLWSEPTGSTGTEITVAKFGEKAYHKVRRFVIIESRKGHCICIPILTYGGQGTLKNGVHADDHAVIYTSKSEGPVLLKTKSGRQEKLKKKAIRMNPINLSHKLDYASRVNYAKVYTVEHNVKVFFIGAIAHSSQQQLVSDYNLAHPQIPNAPPSTGRSSPDLDNQDMVCAEGPTPSYPHSQAMTIPTPRNARSTGGTSGSYSGSYENPVVGSYIGSTSTNQDYSNSSSYQNGASMCTPVASSSSQHYPGSSSTAGYKVSFSASVPTTYPTGNEYEFQRQK
jgi:hypothetical protein